MVLICLSPSFSLSEPSRLFTGHPHSPPREPCSCYSTRIKYIMAWAASTNPEQEYHESVHSVDEKALQLADLIKQSKHFIVFTGAGISTSAGKSLFLQKDADTSSNNQYQEFPTFAALMAHGHSRRRGETELARRLIPFRRSLP